MPQAETASPPMRLYAPHRPAALACSRRSTRAVKASWNRQSSGRHRGRTIRAPLAGVRKGSDF